MDGTAAGPVVSRWRIVVAAAAVVAAAVLFVGGVGVRPGAFREPFSWPAAQVSVAIAAWALSGVAVLARPASRRLGWLMVLAAALLVAGGLIDSSVPLLFTVGLALQWLAIPVQLWAVLGYPSGRLTSSPDRLVVGATATMGLVHGFGSGLLYEPVLHWTWCELCEPGMNLLLVRPVPQVVDAVYLVLIATLGIAALYGAVALVRRWLAANSIARRVRSPMLLAGSVYFAVVALFHLYELGGELGLITLVLPLSQAGLVGWFAMILLPVTFLLGLARGRARRGRVADLISELHTEPTLDQLEDALRRTLGDPSLEVAPLVDGELAVGREGRATTLIHGDGGPLGALVHDPALAEDVRLFDATIAAAKLAIQNASYAAQLKEQLEQVQASRARIVQAADEARRRVERDLHDGAQQQLVALSMMLRKAAARDGDSGVLDAAIRQLDSALHELRDLARGVYPMALVEGGLAAAIDGVVERAAIPVQVEAVPGDRLPDAVEAAAYFVVNEAVTNAAKHARASFVRVSARQQDGALVVEVVDDGCGGAEIVPGGGISGLRDRVEALGGTLTVVDGTAGTTIRAEVPCASS